MSCEISKWNKNRAECRLFWHFADPKDGLYREFLGSQPFQAVKFHIPQVPGCLQFWLWVSGINQARGFLFGWGWMDMDGQFGVCNSDSSRTVLNTYKNIHQYIGIPHRGANTFPLCQRRAGQAIQETRTPRHSGPKTIQNFGHLSGNKENPF